MKNILTLSIKLKSNKTDSVYPFLRHLVDGDWKSARTQARFVGDAAFEAFNVHRSLFKDELKKGRWRNEEDYQTLDLELNLGQKGFELSLAVIEILGPCCDVLDGSYTSDQAADDAQPFPWKFGFARGYVQVHGNPYGDKILTDDDVRWQQGPQLPPQELEAFSQLCKQPLDHSIDALSTRFAELLPLLITLADEHKKELSRADRAQPPKKMWLNRLDRLKAGKFSEHNYPEVARLFCTLMNNILERFTESNYLGSILNWNLTVFSMFDYLHSWAENDSLNEIFADRTTQPDFDEHCYNCSVLI